MFYSGTEPESHLPMSTFKETSETLFTNPHRVVKKFAKVTRSSKHGKYQDSHDCQESV